SAIPHITASSAADVYFAIGFVHAQDRLGQLLRARRMADASWPSDETLSVAPAVSDALASYAAGVNAWLELVSEGGRGRGSPELLIADERSIEAWTPGDSLRIARSFLNGLRPGSARKGMPSISSAIIPADRPRVLELFATNPQQRLNAWAMDGERTATGTPILAADISGSLSLPSEWYLADLQFSTGPVIGATMPGVPFVIVGRNVRVAWAFRSLPVPDEEAPGEASPMQTAGFLTMLELFARSADATDVIGVAEEMLPKRMEALAIDRETVARWPKEEAVRALSFRDIRLAELEARQSIFSTEGAIGVQRDTVSTVARTLLPLMAKELWFVQYRDNIEGTDADDLRRELLDRLASWNGDMDRYSPEPLLFWTWVRALQQRILKDEFPAAQQLWSRPNPDFLYAVLSDRRGSAIWCDIRPSSPRETCEEQVRVALDDALGWLVDRYGRDPSTWSWGEEHNLDMQWLPISSRGLLTDLLSLQAPISGDPFTQFSTSFGFEEDGPFLVNAGSNFQAVMSISEEAGSYYIAPAGQSGHPLSRFYDNLFLSWIQGEYLAMSTDLSLARGGASGFSRLTPATSVSPRMSEGQSE
ncbi:MAG: penicillin acylase family protein, partial [Rhodobacteraceae bacterium]|nr:penicillin acylase family protein [Paracoccaceae bacterium]